MNAQKITVRISKATGKPVRTYRKPTVEAMPEPEEVVAMLLPPPIQVAEPESEVESESESEESESEESESEDEEEEIQEEIQEAVAVVLNPIAEAVVVREPENQAEEIAMMEAEDINRAVSQKELEKAKIQERMDALSREIEINIQKQRVIQEEHKELQKRLCAEWKEMENLTKPKALLVKPAPIVSGGAMKASGGGRKVAETAKKTGEAKARKEDGYKRPITYGHSYLPDEIELTLTLRGETVDVVFEKGESHLADKYHATFADGEEKEFATLNRVSKALAVKVGIAEPNAWTAFKTKEGGKSICRIDLNPL
jgi:hypothetical protein